MTVAALFVLAVVVCGVCLSNGYQAAARLNPR